MPICDLYVRSTPEIYSVQYAYTGYTGVSSTAANISENAQELGGGNTVKSLQIWGLFSHALHSGTFLSPALLSCDTFSFAARADAPGRNGVSAMGLRIS